MKLSPTLGEQCYFYAWIENSRNTFLHNSSAHVILKPYQLHYKCLKFSPLLHASSSTQKHSCHIEISTNGKIITRIPSYIFTITFNRWIINGWKNLHTMYPESQIYIFLHPISVKSLKHFKQTPPVAEWFWFQNW